MSVPILLSPPRIGRILALVVASLTLLSLAATLSAAYLPASGGLAAQVQGSFVRLFYVDLEANVPTWYSSSVLLLCALLLALIAAARWQGRQPFARHWGALALLFLALSIDEAAILHEMAIAPLRPLVAGQPLLYYAWVVPGAAAVVVVGVAFVPFLRHLPARARCLFVAAGAVYVGGALGLESASGLRAAGHGEGDLAYTLFATAEELLEMAGAVLFLFSLLDYASRQLGSLELRLGPLARGVPAVTRTRGRLHPHGGTRARTVIPVAGAAGAARHR